MSDFPTVPSELSPDQIRLCEMLAAAAFEPEEGRTSISAVCEQAGVSRKSYYNWKVMPAFQGYYSQLVKQLSREHLGPIIAAVVKQAENGSFQHAKLFLQYAGEIGEDQHSVNLTVTQQQPAKPGEYQTLRQLKEAKEKQAEGEGKTIDIEIESDNKLDD